MSNTVKVNALSVGYGKNVVLSGVSFALPAGCMAVLIGANGSGKSTLLRAVTGVEEPLSGTVELCDKTTGEYSRRSLARTLSVVFTERSGGGALTVEECVAIGRHPYTGPFGYLGKEDKEIVTQAIAAVGLSDKAQRYAGTLSDGERQKAMIARALAQQTPVIVLDEPTAFLDVAGRLEIIRLLRRLADQGHTVILSTHDIAPAIAMADYLLVIDPQQRTLTAGKKAEITASGILDRAFPEAGLKFDCLSGDFRVSQF